MGSTARLVGDASDNDCDDDDMLDSLAWLEGEDTDDKEDSDGRGGRSSLGAQRGFSTNAVFGRSMVVARCGLCATHVVQQLNLNTNTYKPLIYCTF
jgi:hypothetical protein